MNDFFQDAARRLSSEATADLKRLSYDHGINAQMIQSLLSSKEEASAHIRFFKRMMYSSHSLAIAVGAGMAIFGVIGLVDGFSGSHCAFAGLGLFCMGVFFTTFLTMREAIRETENVAKKHDLI